MAKRVKIELDHEGFHQLLEGQEVTSLVDECGRKLAAKAGPGFIAKPERGGFGGGRHICHVGTGDKESMIAQAESRALQKALYTSGV